MPYFILIPSDLITNHQLVREHITTELLDSKEVWDTLLRIMPTTAMIHNLGKMSSLELLEPESYGVDCPSECSLVTMPYFILLPSDKDSKWMNTGSL
jgi:hypothetical protein